MSKIDELIAQHCPDGVEFKTLNSLCTVFNGYAFKAEKFNNEQIGIPIIRIRDVNTGFSQTYFSGEYDDQYIVQNNDILIGMDGDFLVTRWRHGKAILNQRVCRLQEFSPEIIPDFVFYKVQDELDRIHSSITGSTVKHLSSRDLGNSKIPVPPLEVQREIVRILDKFTQLEAELEAELEKRRQQYEHYRNQLLNSDETLSLALKKREPVRWMTLGEISQYVSSGGTPLSSKDSYYGGTIPWLRTQEVDFNTILATGVTITEEGLKNSSAKWIPANSVIVAMYGATAAKVAINAIPLTTNQACCNLQIDASIAEYRYVFHWISNQYEELKSLGEGSQSNLNAKKVKDFPIRIPSLEIQIQIVEILDKFDALVNDISIGLPAEISARRKQYEYYRDKLLTFAELVA